MNTPIVDFVAAYAASGAARFHMPGHKGVSRLGCEPLDITEIDGADVLYGADGIIRESEENATALFGSAHTFYSTEGSSLCIKAMLALVASTTKKGERVRILAARNAHKAFLYAAALLNLDVVWLYPKEKSHLCACPITAADVSAALVSQKKKIHAVYLTSPDYLGQTQDVKGIADACHAAELPLLVDNAHGAYLAFTEENAHPLTLGADLCCDSAHKTLPVLTGGAYLHVSKNAPESFLEGARNALALFASTSPSYLILQSLDLCNRELAEGYRERLAQCIRTVRSLKRSLAPFGINAEPSEPLKLVLNAHTLGLRGDELAAHLKSQNVVIEFADRQFAVLMFTPDNTDVEFSVLYDALLTLHRRAPLRENAPTPTKARAALSIRDAIFAASEIVPVEEAEGRICAAPLVSCPPAVPIVISGEVIKKDAATALTYYGSKTVRVVKRAVPASLCSPIAGFRDP
ncbi:MAG: PLP-dependent transferase [Clostridia bacterium]|nr:PLP-dependent transferase [Clostridia bacterium]